MLKVSEKTKNLRSKYQERFDPQKHNELFYSKLSKQIEDSLVIPYEAIKQHYEENCKQGEKLKLLDLGCAANPIYVAASVASGVPLEVTLSEFLPQNRDHMKKWINGEEFKVFEKVFDYISKFSGKSSDEIKKTARESIAKLESYDLFQDLSRDYGLYHVIISSYVVECASTNQEEYQELMKKVAGLLAKGGMLVMAGAFGAQYYSNGEVLLESFSLSEEYLRKLIPSLGFQLMRLEVTEREEIFEKLSEYQRNFTLVARKIM